jgi:hypothetical protein
LEVPATADLDTLLIANRWKGALNAFDLTFDGRLSAGRK